MCRLAYFTALDKKAENPVALEIKGISFFTDYFLIVSGNSERQNKTIADEIVRVFKEKEIRPIGVEGLFASKWVLIDFGDLVVHIFDPETRANYNLENLWQDAKRVAFRKPSLKSKKGVSK